MGLQPRQFRDSRVAVRDGGVGLLPMDNLIAARAVIDPGISASRPAGVDVAIRLPPGAVFHLGALKIDPHGEEALLSAVSNHEAAIGARGILRDAWLPQGSSG